MWLKATREQFWTMYSHSQGKKRKSQLEGSKGSFAFQPSTGLLSSSFSPWLQESSKQQHSQLKEGKGFLCCPVKGQEKRHHAAWLWPGSGLTGSSCQQLPSTILSVLHIKMDVTFRPGISSHKPAAQLQVKRVMAAKLSKLGPKSKLYIKSKMHLGLHPFLPRGKNTHWSLQEIFHCFVCFPLNTVLC